MNALLPATRPRLSREDALSQFAQFGSHRAAAKAEAAVKEARAALEAAEAEAAAIAK